MNDLITIGSTQFAAKTLDGKPVLTFRDIDTIHHRPEGSARKRFNDNRQRFVEGEDYMKICASEFRTHFDGLSNKATEDVYLFTESGYLMIVKSFTDDWAWEVQRKLVKTYFRAKELAAETPKTLSHNEMFASLSPQTQALINMELRLNKAEADQQATKAVVMTTISTFAAAPTEEEHWRDEMNRRVRSMCEEYGLNYHTTIGDMYAELERRARVNLTTRQRNLRERMRLGGAKYAQRDAVSKLVVIPQDAKLRCIYESIVREKQAQLAASRKYA